MDKRNKLWRREQQNRVFKARMVYHAACGCGIKKADGNWNRHPHWFELARVKWMQIYKPTLFIVDSFQVIKTDMGTI